jgi:hypothetical protein
VTDEEIADALYGSRGQPKWDPGKPQTPPAEPEPEQEPEAEKEPEKDAASTEDKVDWEFEETPDGKGLKPKGDGLGGLLAGDNRLMQFLEDDIEALEKAAEDEERKLNERWKL